MSTDYNVEAGFGVRIPQSLVDEWDEADEEGMGTYEYLNRLIKAWPKLDFIAGGDFITTGEAEYAVVVKTTQLEVDRWGTQGGGLWKANSNLADGYQELKSFANAFGLSKTDFGYYVAGCWS